MIMSHSLYHRFAQVVLLLLLAGSHLHGEGDSKSGTNAMWIYKTDPIMADQCARDELFAFCAARRIVDLFWQTHYTAALGEPKGGDVLIPNAGVLRAFLGQAGKHGLRIHALSGDPSYVEPKNQQRALARVEATINFNKASPPGERFAGVHFDIEPHGLSSWKSSDNAQKCVLLTQLVEVSAKAAERIHAASPELLFGADVTFWFDKTSADGSSVYPVTFRGATKDATKHLLDLADNIAIMSYRNTALGKNGIINLVSQTVAYADTSRGKAYVGVKMANIGPPMEGFYGSSEEDMMTALKPLVETYGDHRGYACIGYFMYEAYREMPRKAASKPSKAGRATASE